MKNATYSTAAAQATEITVTELVGKLTADDSPRIFPGNNRESIAAKRAEYFNFDDNGRGIVIFHEPSEFAGFTRLAERPVDQLCPIIVSVRNAGPAATGRTFQRRADQCVFGDDRNSFVDACGGHRVLCVVDVLLDIRVVSI